MPTDEQIESFASADGAPKGSDLAAQLAPYIAVKVVLTTGVSPDGLGASFVSIIAAHSPGLLILAGRNKAKSQATADALTASHPELATRVLALDLASQAAVRKAADEVNGWADVPAIDVLVLNAGIMGTKEYQTTPEGLELQFGSNYVGHWLFGNLIMGKVLKGTGTGVNGEKTVGGRVVSVSSDGARLDGIRFHDLDFNKGEFYNAWRAYGQSKTGNCLYAVSLAKKLGPKGVVAMSLHPGVISTNLSSHLDDFDDLVKLDKEQGATYIYKGGFRRVTRDQGAATHVFAGFSPEAAKHNGRFAGEANVWPLEDVWSWARDEVDAEKLWKVTEDLVGQKFEW